jgi:hypothetical protein
MIVHIKVKKCRKDQLRFRNILLLPLAEAERPCGNWGEGMNPSQSRQAAKKDRGLLSERTLRLCERKNYGSNL